MRNITFKPDAFKDYSEWAQVNKKIYEKLMKLIVETARTPFEGTGKPEALKHELSSLWSRRITEEHRLVYEVTDEDLIIVSCKYHY